MPRRGARRPTAVTRAQQVCCHATRSTWLWLILHFAAGDSRSGEASLRSYGIDERSGRTIAEKEKQQPKQQPPNTGQQLFKGASSDGSRSKRSQGPKQPQGSDLSTMPQPGPKHRPTSEPTTPGHRSPEPGKAGANRGTRASLPASQRPSSSVTSSTTPRLSARASPAAASESASALASAHASATRTAAGAATTVVGVGEHMVGHVGKQAMPVGSGVDAVRRHVWATNEGAT
jgi:hypothetical protein